MTFTKWASIEGFHNIRKAVVKYDLYDGEITYRAKIKLHGTNAGIVIKPNGDIFAQSRTSIIAVGNDNAGFAAWLESTKDVWKGLTQTTPQVTIFGEWCGPGIQKGVAVNNIKNKVFAIFSIQLGVADEDDNAMMIVDPDELTRFFDIENITLPDNVYILPWYGDEIVIDYHDAVSLVVVVDTINKIVDEVEAVDPWVKEVFDVEGTGEGLVYYPVSFQAKQGFMARWHMSTFMFKAKGEKHKVQKDRKAVIIDPEVVESINDFADKFVTVARLEQGATEINRGVLDFDSKLIGAFIGWFSKDVSKESADELEASDLDWKQVNKEITTRAREWYLSKLEEI